MGFRARVLDARLAACTHRFIVRWDAGDHLHTATSLAGLGFGEAHGVQRSVGRGAALWLLDGIAVLGGNTVPDTRSYTFLP